MSSSDVPLGEQIRRRVDEGELPRDRPPKLWVSFGSGEPCAACDSAISPAQGMNEVEWEETTYRFHIRCHALWVGELIYRILTEPE
jgi:hypothetical protein